MVEQMAARFPDVFHLFQESTEDPKLGGLNPRQLGNLGFLFPVMGEHVPVGLYARDVAGHRIHATEVQGIPTVGVGISGHRDG